jgi:hypothetical protein
MDTVNSQVSYKKPRRKWPFFLFGGVAILGVVLAVFFFFYFEEKTAIPPVENPEKLTVAQVANPIEFFYKNFSNHDYSVKIIQHDKAFFTLYYQKGVLVRVDGEDQYSKDTSTIIKNGKLYSVNDKMKQFAEIDAGDPQARYILEIFKAASGFMLIIEGETPTASPWTFVQSKPENKNLFEYETSKRKLVSYIPTNDNSFDIKIVLDSEKALITEASLRAAGSQEWGTMKFEYQQLQDIESFKSFPRDYTKIETR